MTESAESVAADVDSKRSVTVEIKNYTNSYCLVNPKVFLLNGETYNPPQPTVRPLKTEVCTFTKTGSKATGCVGVMTYDLYPRDPKDSMGTVGIMFSVPWDYNIFKNWNAVGIFDKGQQCDKELYEKMYNEKKQKDNHFVREESTGTGMNYVRKSLDIRATMSPMEKSIMKVEVWDDLFTLACQQSF